MMMQEQSFGIVYNVFWKKIQFFQHVVYAIYSKADSYTGNAGHTK